MNVDGVLVVDKPVGMTSFDVVRQVRRAANMRRVGHGGTLDPLVGIATDTDDADGAEVARSDAGGVDAALVDAALGRFRGPIEQVPPHYSALKRAGRPLYDYARAGEPITPDARRVTVFELELLAFRGPAAVDLRVLCSKGTYVRALARDLGRALGVGGHVTALRRTRSGPFALSSARTLDAAVAGLQSADTATLGLVSLADALGHLQSAAVPDEIARDLRLGRRVSWLAVAGDAPIEEGARPRRVLDSAGALIAVAEAAPDGLTRTLRVFGIPH